MKQCVEISFDCLPLRSIGRLDIPIDASPSFQARCHRILQAIEKHGCHNSYFLHNATCKFHLTNDESIGTLAFAFEGTLLTDSSDTKSERSDLHVELTWENCGWITEPIVGWFSETVSQAVLVEFDRYIAAGDLSQTRERIEAMQESEQENGGFLGMYL